MEILRRLRGIFTFVFAFGGLIGFLPFSNSIDYQNDEYGGTKLLLYIFLYFIILIGLILWGIWEGDVTAEDLNKAKKNYAFMEKNVLIVGKNYQVDLQLNVLIAQQIYKILIKPLKSII